MTVINQNSISGITSITAASGSVQIFNSDGSSGSLTDLAGINVAGVVTATSYSGTSDTIKFETGGSERARIDSSGLFGLGTNSPGALLNTRWTGTRAGSTGVHFATSHGDSSDYTLLKVSTSEGGADSKTKFLITGEGKIGVGTASPQNLFVVSNEGNDGIEINPTGENSDPAIYSYSRSGDGYRPLTFVTRDIRFNVGSSPSEKVRIDDSGRLLVGTSTAPSGQVDFVINRTSGPGSIQLAYNGASGGAIVPGASGGLEFFTYTGSIGSETYTERFRITSAGDMAFGSTSVSTTAQSNGSTVLSPVLEIKGTNSGAVNATGAIRLQRQDGTAGAFIYSSGDDGGLNLRTVDANGITFRNSSGSALGFWRNGGGLTFNGDTAAVNALDDYEEGTWTPELQYFSGGAWYANSFTQGPTYTTGYYVKIGNIVHFRWYSGLTNINSGTGANARISGLPYNAMNVNGGYSGAYFQYTSAFSSAANTGYIGINSNIIYPTLNGSTNSPNWVGGSTVYLMVAGTYQTT